MQDGNAIPADEAGEWLGENLRGRPERHSELIISDEAMDPASRARLLEILFGSLPQ
jgi:hypothetical protein